MVSNKLIKKKHLDPSNHTFLPDEEEGAPEQKELLEKPLLDLQLTSEAPCSPDDTWEQEETEEESPQMESTESWNKKINKT